jgi:N-methylhydantoinase B
MDHGRSGPPGILGGAPGGPNEIVICSNGEERRPAHWSKDEDIPLRPGDWVQVRTPGGGGYGDPFTRDPALVFRDVRRGYLTPADAESHYGVALQISEDDGASRYAIDEARTAALRGASRPVPSTGEEGMA